MILKELFTAISAAPIGIFTLLLMVLFAREIATFILKCYDVIDAFKATGYVDELHARYPDEDHWIDT